MILYTTSYNEKEYDVYIIYIWIIVQVNIERSIATEGQGLEPTTVLGAIITIMCNVDCRISPKFWTLTSCHPILMTHVKTFYVDQGRRAHYGPLWPKPYQKNRSGPASLNPNHSVGRRRPPARSVVRALEPPPSRPSAERRRPEQPAPPSRRAAPPPRLCLPSARPEAPSRSAATARGPPSARPASARRPEQRSRWAAPRLRPSLAVRSGSDRATPRLRGSGAPPTVRRALDGPSRRAAPRLRPPSARPEQLTRSAAVPSASRFQPYLIFLSSATDVDPSTIVV
jgi:hypothetical protein